MGWLGASFIFSVSSPETKIARVSYSNDGTGTSSLHREHMAYTWPARTTSARWRIIISPVRRCTTTFSEHDGHRRSVVELGLDNYQLPVTQATIAAQSFDNVEQSLVHKDFGLLEG
jgi:hypothetical protein